MYRDLLLRRTKEKYLSEIRSALLCGADVPHRHHEDVNYPIPYLKDNTGDNISAENLQYSELTGFYWVWKNEDADVVGLEHYRRHFIKPNRKIDDFVHTEDLLDEKDITHALENADFIIPVPEQLANTSVFDLYRICFGDQADDIVQWMKSYFIKNGMENYLTAMYDYMSHNILYRANMFITTKKEFDEYCSVMFDMIDYMKKYMVVKPDSRVWGYVTENFLAIYVTANKKVAREVDMAVDDFNQDIQKDVVYTTYNKERMPFDKDASEQIKYFKSL